MIWIRNSYAFRFVSLREWCRCLQFVEPTHDNGYAMHFYIILDISILICDLNLEILMRFDLLVLENGVDVCNLLNLHMIMGMRSIFILFWFKHSCLWFELEILMRFDFLVLENGVDVCNLLNLHMIMGMRCIFILSWF